MALVLIKQNSVVIENLLTSYRSSWKYFEEVFEFNPRATLLELFDNNAAIIILCHKEKEVGF